MSLFGSQTGSPDGEAQNKRASYRQPMYTPIHLRVTELRETLPATLVNISGGGCRIAAAVLVQTRFPVRFNLPRPGLTDLVLTGTIRRIRHAKHDRTYHYGVAFQIADESERDELLRFVGEEQLRALKGTRASAGPPPRPKRLLEQRSCARTVASFPVRYTVPEQPGVTHEALALDLSTGGMRIVTDRILRREWNINVNISLPSEGLRTAAPFMPLSLLASPLPGIRNSRGRYVHSLSFQNPSAAAIDEILRFIRANELSRTSRSSP